MIDQVDKEACCLDRMNSTYLISRVGGGQFSPGELRCSSQPQARHSKASESGPGRSGRFDAFRVLGIST